MSQLNKELGLSENTFTPTPEDGVPSYNRVSRVREDLTLRQLGQDVEDAGQELLSKAQETFDLVLPEGENLAKGVLNTGKRLDSKERVFQAIPNSVLIFGGLAVILFFVLKK